MRSLILSSRPADPRGRALVSLGGGDASVTLAEGDRLPDLATWEALVLDDAGSPVTPSDGDRLRAFVEAGGSLLVFTVPGGAGAAWCDLAGVRPLDALRRGEYFAHVLSDTDGLGTRLDAEFPFVGGFVPLDPTAAAATLASVSVGFQERALVTSTLVGAGRVTVCGLGPEEAAATPLATLLRRALSPRAAAGAGADDPLGLAIVGYGPFGGMGYYHGLGIAATPGLELVAIADPSDARRKAAEDDFAGIAAYATVDEVAADPAVDLVVVATPPSAHFGITRQLLRAGKHVACEKPLCLTAAEADELIATAQTNERVLTVHQNRRWDADFLAVRRAVDAGLLGDLFNVETFVGGFEHPCRAWHSDVVMSGGAVYDWGSHHVDWILQLLGDAPARVVTFGHKRVWHDVTNLDQLRLHLAWDDGREAEFFQSDVAGVRRPKFFVQGTEGTLVGRYRPLTFERIEPGRGHVADQPHHAEAPAELTLARYESGYGLTETRLPPAREQRFAFHRNLADHLHLGEPLAVTAASVRSVVAVLEASQRSSDEGGRVVELAP